VAHEALRVSAGVLLLARKRSPRFSVAEDVLVLDGAISLVVVGSALPNKRANPALFTDDFVEQLRRSG
jgi:hypothetical protein